MTWTTRSPDARAHAACFRPDSRQGRRLGRLFRDGRRWLGVAVVLGGALWRFAAPARAAVSIMPIDEVRPGMRGVGRTVFAGETIEDFSVEVIDIIHRARPQGDLILFRGSGDILEHAGIIAGMSGSPVYLDGKLAGAVAFAYPLLKDPIGGITPIEEMLDLDRFPLPPVNDSEGRESGPPGGVQAPPRRETERRSIAPADDGESRARADAGGARFAGLWGDFTAGRAGALTDPAAVPSGANAPSPTMGETARSPEGLRPLTVPLACSGWEPGVLDAARGPAASAGFLMTIAGAMAGDAPADASGRGAAAAAGTETGRSPLEPGSALAVELVGGDATIAAIGTVTAVDGNRVYAFGHPMVQGGSVAFPLYGARIHTVMPNLQNSFKMGSPTRPLGGIWEDRRPGVLGLLGDVPSTIPVRVTISLPGQPDHAYGYRIVRDPVLSTVFLPWVVSNSYQHRGWAQGETTARADVEVHFDGGKTVRREELMVTDQPALGLGSSAVLPASLLLMNPFTRVRLDSLSVRIDAEPGHAAAEITHLRCTPSRAAPGDTLRAEITLRLWRGGEETRTARIVVPAAWAGKRLRVVAAGSGETMEWDRERAPGKWNPRDLDDLVRMIESLPSAGSILLRVTARDGGALVRGRELPSLPTSLVSAGVEPSMDAAIRPVATAVLEERAIDTPWEITGREAAGVEIMR